ncbi:hypothetical protein BDZ97DRAFT_1762162 [Flammula alnicola]|nr:hypothetical protein BDZ97DRAFT_1762162 [Flammula alnicola]
MKSKKKLRRRKNLKRGLYPTSLIPGGLQMDSALPKFMLDSWWSPDGVLTAGFVVEQEYQEFRWSPTGVQMESNRSSDGVQQESRVLEDLLKFLSTPILCKDLTAGGRRDASDIWNLCWALEDVMLEQTIVDIVSGNNTVPEEQVEHFLGKVTDIFLHFAIQYDHCKAQPLAKVLLHCSGDESPAHDEWDLTDSMIKDNVFVNYICGQLLDLYFPVSDYFVPAWMDFFNIHTTAELGYSIMQALTIPLPETIEGTVIIDNDHIPSKQLLTCAAMIALLNKMIRVADSDLNVVLADLCCDLEMGNFMNDIAHMGIEQCHCHLQNV